MKTVLVVSTFLFYLGNPTVLSGMTEAQTTDGETRLVYYIALRDRNTSSITCDCSHGGADKTDRIYGVVPNDDQLWTLAYPNTSEYFPPKATEPPAKEDVIYIINIQDNTCLGTWEGSDGIFWLGQSKCEANEGPQEWLLKYAITVVGELHYYYLENMGHIEMGITPSNFATTNGNALHLWGTNNARMEQQWAFSTKLPTRRKLREPIRFG